MPKRILVLTDHMPWGHRSIAKAIYGFLKTKEKESNIKVEYAEVKAELGIADDLYTFIYRFFPVGNKITQKLMEYKMARQILEDMSKFNLPRIKKIVKDTKPDLIISTYFFHTHSLVKWRREEGINFKLWTVAADPWTVNPSSFAPEADLHLVYDETAAKLALKYGVGRNGVLKTGWWVRPEMYTDIDRIKARKKLGFADDRPVIFVGGGSLGTNAITRLLPALMFVNKKIGFVFNTGTDKFAYNLVKEYAVLYKKLRKDNLVQIVNLGWIDNMAEVLTACDIVFGKAGPNFLFDVVARQKPFVAITHIGGQEDGNIDLILKKKLGWVKEKTNEAAKFLLNYTEKPDIYNSRYNASIKKEALKNKCSLEKILKKIEKL